jgi:hypothetical protein
LLYPTIWLIAAILSALATHGLHTLYPVVPSAPLPAALFIIFLAITGGLAAIRYLRLARETTRAVRVGLTRHRWRVTIARLRVDRSELTDAIEIMKGALDLPGSVTADGRVLATEEVPPGGRA